MDERNNPDAIEAARAEGIAIGIRRGARAMALYVMDRLLGTFEEYRREDRDSILIDDARVEVALCIGRAFRKRDKDSDAEEPANN